MDSTHRSQNHTVPHLEKGSRAAFSIASLILTAILTACGATGGDGAIPPEADFSFVQTDGTLTIVFTNTSSTVDTSEWDFDNGMASTERSPEHTYDGPGSYDVRLTVTSDGGTDTAVVRVTVEAVPGPTVELTGTPLAVRAGTQTVLEWVLDNAGMCTASSSDPASTFTGDRDPVSAIESVTVTIDATYQISCVTGGVTRSDSVTITVLPPPTVLLSASPNPVDLGGITRLTWVVQNATSCSGTGGAFAGDNKDPNGGFEDVIVGSDTVFGLTCSGPGADDVESAPVTVLVNLAFTSASVAAGPNLKQLVFSWTLNTTAGVDHFVLEVNPDGSSGYSQVDLDGDGGEPDAADEISVSEESAILSTALHLTDFDNASYQVVARGAGPGNAEVARSAGLFIDDNGGIDDIKVEELIGYLKASNTDQADQFGFSLSLSADGNTLAVGAAAEDSSGTGVDSGLQDDNTEFNSGAVFVFIKDPAGVWSQQAYLKASNTQSLDIFGGSVSLSADGNTLAVGAYGEFSGISGDQNDNTSRGAGAVYVFVRDSESNWSQQAYVKANIPGASNGTGASDNFGFDLSLSADGNILAIGAAKEDSNSLDVNNDPTAFTDDQNDDSATDAGAVYVFGRDTEGNWTERAYLKPCDAETLDGFGADVSLSADGNTLAVSAGGDDSFHQAPIPYFPFSECFEGTDNLADGAGAVYVFSRSPGGTWSLQIKMKSSNAAAGDGFGGSVSLSADGNTLVVGATGEDSSASGIDGDQVDDTVSGSGAAYVFRRDAEANWSQEAYVKASNPDQFDGFGGSVSVSADGSILAVGATGESSNATGVNGDQFNNSAGRTGAVYTFIRGPSDDWIQRAYVKPSSPAGFGEGFGSDVSLAADGNTLAVGSQFEDSNAAGIGGNQSDNSARDAGAVYLY